MKYSSRGLRRRGDTDKWEVTLVHKDPLTGESVRSYHTVTARTEKQAERKKNELIRRLDSQGLAAGTRMTIAELADSLSTRPTAAPSNAPRSKTTRSM